MSALVDVAFATDPLDPAPVWTDVTRHVKLDPPISIAPRGAADELAQIQTGACTMTLDNSDGRFTPNRAASPYYPNVQKGRRIRVRVVSVDTNYVTNPTFEAGVVGWSRLNPADEPELVPSALRSHTGTQSLLVVWGGANPLTNWSFEVLPPWIPHNAATIAAAADGTSKTGSVLVTSTTNASSTGVKIDPPLTTGIAPGDQFQFTADIFPVSVSVTPVLAVQWYDATAVLLGTTTATPAAQTAGVWSTVTGVLTAPALATQARVLLTGGTIPAAQAFKVDTILFQDLAVPATQGTSTVLAGLDVGKTYTASAWVYVPTGSPAVRLGVTGLSTGTASASTNTWVQVSYPIAATSTSHTLQLTPSTAPSAGGLRVWVDDVQVNDGASVATFSATGAVVSNRYDGFVNRWPTEWPGGGRVSLAPITCSDIFKQLEKASLDSFLEEEVRGRDPIAYYTLSEAADSDSAGDDSDNMAGSLTVLQVGSGGTLVFGTGAGAPADGLGAPEFTPVDATNGRMLTGDVGTAIEAATNTDPVVVEAWFTTTTTGRVIAALRSADNRFELILSLDSATGKLKVQTVQSGTANVSTLWGTVSLADDQPHHVMFVESTTKVFIDGVDKGAGAITGVSRLRYLSVGGYSSAGLWQGSIGHVAVYADAAVHGVDQALAHYTAGYSGYAGDTAAARVVRIAGYAGVDASQVTSVGTLFGPIASQGPGGKSALALMREVETTESCRLFGGRGGGLVLQARDVRYAPAVALVLDTADVEGEMRFTDDDQFLTNEVTATRPGGATIRLTDKPSRAKYGKAGKPLTLLKPTDAGVAAAAAWHIQRYRDPLPRLPAVPVEAYTLGVTAFRALLGLDISSVFQLSNLLDQAPGTGTELVCVEGYQEKIGNNQLWLNFYTSPASLDQAWILGDATYSVLGSTTYLAY